MISGEVELLPWVLYAVVVSLLLSAAAWSISFGLQRLRLPTRWVWALAVALTVALPASSLLLPGLPGTSERSAPVVPSAVSSLEELRESPTAGGEDRGDTTSSALLLAWAPDRLAEAAAWLNGLLVRGANALPARDALPRWTAAAWGAGTVALTIVFLTSAWRMSHRRRRWPRSVLRGRAVRLTPDLGPAVGGLIRPEILLPRWALALERRTLDLVLRHEEEHLRARDPLLLAGALALVVLVPWNLCLWWQFRRLRDAVELDCDRRVLDRGVAPTVYGRLLLELGSSRRKGELLPALAVSRLPALTETAMAATPSLLERRLNAMKKQSVRSVLPLTIFGTAAGIALFAMACGLDTPTHLPDEGAPVETAEAQASAVEEADGSDARSSETLRELSVLIRRPDRVPAEDAPLVVVDGVVLGNGAAQLPGAGEPDAESGAPGSSPLEGLSISSVEVLKGAAAHARYGERARNGVILITTEAGEDRLPRVGETGTSPEPRGDAGDAAPLADAVGAVPIDDAGDEWRYFHVEVHQSEASERLDLDVERHRGDQPSTRRWLHDLDTGATYQSGWLLGARDGQRETPESEGHGATHDPLDPDPVDPDPLDLAPLDLPQSHDAGDAPGPDPLYVVDGIIVSAPVDLDADEIEQVEVVKGAAARELYGTRAASGVVVITTRRESGT